MTGPNIDQMPLKLRRQPQWVCYKSVAKADGKTDKIPIDPKTGKTASVSNPETYTDFSTAINYYRNGNGVAGVGFVFTDKDEFAGVDLDDCINEQGELKDWARTILDGMKTYAEVSPSGKGIKLFMTGSVPKAIADHKRGIEIYDRGRFFTVTGNWWRDSPSTIEDCGKALLELYREVGGSNGNGAQAGRNPIGWQDDSLKGVSSGTRHGVACELASRWAAKGHSAAEIGHFIVAWNKNNIPPKPELSDLNSKELRDIVESAIGKFRKGATPPIEWADPFDIFGDPELVGSPALLPEHLPRVIADFAADASERIGVPLEMIAIPALGVAGGVISDSLRLQVKEQDDTWNERGKLWIGLVADSGQKKTPALNTVLAPLRDIESTLYEENQVKKLAYDDEVAEYRKQVKKIPGYNRPERPAYKRKLVNDITVEALRDILVDNPEGVILIQDELGGWFTSFDQYKQKGNDRAHYLQMFNGGPHFIDRVKDGGCSIRVPNWSAGLVGGIQPGPMKRLAGKITDDGLIQRFLVFYTRAVGTGIDRPADLKSITAFHAAFRELSRLAPPPEGAFRFSHNAQKIRRLVDAYVSAFCDLPDTPEHLKAHLSKYPIFFARLCLVCHCLNCVSRAPVAVDPMIPVETAKGVFSLLLNFFLPHSVRFFDELLPGERDTDDARWIAGYILTQKTTEITAREIYRAYRPLRRDKNIIPMVMAKLSIGGWVEDIDQKRKDSLRWAVNPKVHEKFGAMAEQEKRRREAEKRRIADAVKFIQATKEVTRD